MLRSSTPRVRRPPSPSVRADAEGLERRFLSVSRPELVCDESGKAGVLCRPGLKAGVDALGWLSLGPGRGVVDAALSRWVECRHGHRLVMDVFAMDVFVIGIDSTWSHRTQRRCQ